jgi:uncharacterized protein GlcG (DUF336 family)
MDLSLEVSYRKAYTAMTFTNKTSALEERFTGPFSVGKIDKVLLSAGGVPIQASGETIGGVGVSILGNEGYKMITNGGVNGTPKLNTGNVEQA